MTRARLEPIAADEDAAARLLAQAHRHLASARSEGVDPESAYALCYQAALKALVATLTAAGVRATAGAGSHVVLLREGGRRLGLDRELTDRIDRMRRTRHGVFYEAEEVSATELRAALADASAVIDAAKGKL